MLRSVCNRFNNLVDNSGGLTLTSGTGFVIFTLKQDTDNQLFFNPNQILNGSKHT